MGQSIPAVVLCMRHHPCFAWRPHRTSPHPGLPRLAPRRPPFAPPPGPRPPLPPCRSTLCCSSGRPAASLRPARSCRSVTLQGWAGHWAGKCRTLLYMLSVQGSAGLGPARQGRAGQATLRGTSQLTRAAHAGPGMGQSTLPHAVPPCVGSGPGQLAGCWQAGQGRLTMGGKTGS